jgi:hypothetical protein
MPQADRSAWEAVLANGEVVTINGESCFLPQLSSSFRLSRSGRIGANWANLANRDSDVRDAYPAAKLSLSSFATHLPDHVYVAPPWSERDGRYPNLDICEHLRHPS